jgi:gluconolactonase
VHRILSFVSLAIVATWLMRAQDNILGSGFQQQPRGSEKVNGPAFGILTSLKPWDLLGQGYQLTGDSTADKEGNVYFTDSRNNRILRVDLAGKISVWKEGSNGAHGVAYGPDGRLYAGQHERKRIVAFSSDGTESVIAEGPQSHHLTVTSRNQVYFSEPPAHKVWMVDAAGHERVVYDHITWPRGVRVSPDQSRLVVNDPPTRWVWSFQIQADGSLINGRPFYYLQASEESSETDAGGMVFDSEGFLYVATKQGVQIFDPLGRVTAILNAPGREAVTNVFFGGPGLHWLYLTDGDRLYRRPVKRSGAAPWTDAKPRP